MVETFQKPQKKEENAGQKIEPPGSCLTQGCQNGTTRFTKI